MSGLAASAYRPTTGCFHTVRSTRAGDCIETQLLISCTILCKEARSRPPTRNPWTQRRTNSPHSDAPAHHCCPLCRVRRMQRSAGWAWAALAARTNATTARTIVISSCFNRIKLSALSRNSLMRNFSYPRAALIVYSNLRSVNVKQFSACGAALLVIESPSLP